MRSTSRLLALLTAAMLSGCSGENMPGGETMSVEEYFAELDVVAQTTDHAFAQWEQEISDALESVTTPEEASEVFRPLLEDGVVILQATVDQLEDLSPPDEVADAHTAFTDSLRAGLDAVQGLVDDYNNIGFEGVVAAFQGGELRDLEQEQNATCADLQMIAAESGVDVDLGCGE